MIIKTLHWSYFFKIYLWLKPSFWGRQTFLDWTTYIFSLLNFSFKTMSKKKFRQSQNEIVFLKHRLRVQNFEHQIFRLVNSKEMHVQHYYAEKRLLMKRNIYLLSVCWGWMDVLSGCILGWISKSSYSKSGLI